jgi:hypothetical protein
MCSLSMPAAMVRNSAALARHVRTWSRVTSASAWIGGGASSSVAAMGSLQPDPVLEPYIVAEDELPS